MAGADTEIYGERDLRPRRRAETRAEAAPAADAVRRAPSRKRVFGIDVDDLTMAEAVSVVRRSCAGPPSLVFTPNAQHVCLLRSRADFRAAYRDAALILADSVPLVWASRWLGRPLGSRVAGSDLLPALCEAAAADGLRVFFLGAAPGVGALAARNLRERFPRLSVAGVCSPPWGFQQSPRSDLQVVRSVRAARPDILFVALGSPKGEVWAWRHRSALGVPVVACVGAALDFAAGAQVRAPGWMRGLGLEWSFRLAREPRRLWKRYLIGNMHFLFLLVKEIVRDRTAAERPAPAAPARGKTSCGA